MATVFTPPACHISMALATWLAAVPLVWKELPGLVAASLLELAAVMMNGSLASLKMDRVGKVAPRAITADYGNYAGGNEFIGGSGGHLGITGIITGDGDDFLFHDPAFGIDFHQQPY